MHYLCHFMTGLVLLVLSVRGIALHDGFPKDRRYLEERDGITYHIVEHARTATKLSFVTNSGICETTAGVNQYSGYLTVNALNVFFWFFEARHNPASSPLVMWLNGGPGCSSMMGLFVEHGPCTFPPGQTEPQLNPFSWNTVANMLYIDQPAETGFSYGPNNVTTTSKASDIIWIFTQIFYDSFPQYQNRNFSLFTESYGGHFGPAIIENFHRKNTAIDHGHLPGSYKIPVVSLGINNAWLDPVTQYRSYLTFALNNTYRPLLNISTFLPALDKYTEDCLPQIQNCTATTGDPSNCSLAIDVCYISTAYQVEQLQLRSVDGGFNQYDIRQPADDVIPPDMFVSYLNRDEVKISIGVPVKMGFVGCLESISDRFEESGDQARSFLGQLGEVVRMGVNVLVWAGDADWVCNWMGNFDLIQGINFPNQQEFVNKPVVPFTVNGQVYGEYKTVNNLSWLRVYNSGHMVPYYQPLMSLQVFTQAIYGVPIYST
ncbi:putative carboxypeptidase S1 [Cladorrhinum sp. PSN259]|nr:putative carboxypeptidase S1 [Cladorrhinum sp. PSN259]